METDPYIETRLELLRALITGHPYEIEGMKAIDELKAYDVAINVALAETKELLLRFKNLKKS